MWDGAYGEEYLFGQAVEQGDIWDCFWELLLPKPLRFGGMVMSFLTLENGENGWVIWYGFRSKRL